MADLREFGTIFWDFDGVIKESLDIKGQIFSSLFEDQGPEFQARVMSHHLQHGGVSRFKKLEQYLSWAYGRTDPGMLSKLLDQFSVLSVLKVVNSPWAPCVQEYLITNSAKQTFFLLTATPQKDIDCILNKLGIKNCFKTVYGGEYQKSAVVRKELLCCRLNDSSAVLIGDSYVDYYAAIENKIDFLLKKTNFNIGLQKHFTGKQIKGFCEWIG